AACATRIVRCPAARSPSTVNRTWFWPPRHVRAVSMWIENTASGALSKALLPQLRELQKHVVRVEHRDEKPCGAIAEPVPQHVVAKEGECRAQCELARRHAAVLGRPLLGGEGRVSIDRGDVIADVAVGEVREIVLQNTGVAGQRDGFVYAPAVP